MLVNAISFLIASLVLLITWLLVEDFKDGVIVLGMSSFFGALIMFETILIAYIIDWIWYIFVYN
jgi:hypothetical protein